MSPNQSVLRQLILRTSFGSIALCCALAVGQSPGIGFVDDFSTDPFPSWMIANGPGPGFADNSNGQIGYDAGAGELGVFYDSSQPTVRIQHPIGAILTPDDAFKFVAVLRFDSIVAAPCEFMQINLALTNSATTGAVRAGPSYDSANTFDNLELAYYPNTSMYFGGPWLTLTVQGSPQGAASAFAHFNFVSAPANLPTGETLMWRGAYTPADRIVRFRCTGGIELALSLDGSAGFLPPHTFAVDMFSITSYLDGADSTPGSISLLADTAYTWVSVRLSGDADQDDDVDLRDFAAAQNCFSGMEPSSADCDPLDFDDDGHVDLADHASFVLVMNGPE